MILHVDMDAFYASVEERARPALVGKPVIVGGTPEGRGVVAAANYVARKFGVHSAMPAATAHRLCPHGVFLRPRMDHYAEVSDQIRAIFEKYTPLVEPLSLDEAFLDVTGSESLFGSAVRIGRAIKQEIGERLRLIASVGVAPNKFLAKIASDLEKPDGLVVLPIEEGPARLHPLPVERLWGVGPRTAEHLHAASVRTIGDLLKVPRPRLERCVGASAAGHLLSLARGEDDRPVETGREAKSISEERTYGADLTDPDDIDRALLERADGVARELRRCGLVGRTVQIKVRTGDFTTWTRARTLPEPTDLPEAIVAAARDLFREKIRLRGKGVRLLGVGISALEPEGHLPAKLFPDPAEERARRLAKAADAVRDRFGEEAVKRARLLRRPRGKKDKAPPEASSLPTVD